MAAAGLLLDLFPYTNYTQMILTNHSLQDRVATRSQKSGGEEAEQLQPSEEKEEESKSWKLGQGAQCT